MSSKPPGSRTESRRRGSYASTASSPSHEARSSSSACTALRHRAREAHVLVDRVHPQDGGLAVGGGVDLPDQPVLVEHREGEVAPAALGRGLVHLEGVLELEQLLARGAGRRRAGRTATAAPSVPRSRRPSAAGSTRHSPLMPSTTAGSPASPTSTGSIGILVVFCRAMPSEASRRSFLIRRASSSDGTTTSAGYTRSARSHSRSRPTRPAIATSPRIIRNSSIWVTLRSFVHPVDAHGTTHVSGMSRELSGPELPSSSRMSRRKRSLSRIQACVRS